MKKLMLMCLLGVSAMALAQTPDTTAAPKHGGKNSNVADLELSSADEAKLQGQLDEARRKLDEAAQQVAELSMQLGHREGNPDVMFFNTAEGPRRAVLGVQIDPDSGKEGARVL